MPSLQSIVKARCAATAGPVPYQPRDNLLFQYLYDSYCALTGKDDSFAALEKRAYRRNALGYLVYSTQMYRDACEALSDWYASRYPVGKGADGRGLDRAVTGDILAGKREYRFDEPFRAERFAEYLCDGSKALQKGDGYNFLLQTSVAFLLSPEQVETLLQFYGYHPLHARNIHHLAICAVLNGARTCSDRASVNPFPEIRGLYEEARSLLQGAAFSGTKSMSEQEVAVFAGNSTRVVRNFMMGADLTGEKLLGYVGRHVGFYSMRPSRLLKEDERMAALFAVLYNTERLKKGETPSEESGYSLYSFVNRFVRPMKRKVFFDHIHNQIVNNGRHPTREAMILLWMYSYSFLFLPEVMGSRNFATLRPFETMSEFDGASEYPFEPYFDPDSWNLEVLRYLSEPNDRAAPLRMMGVRSLVRTFRGAEMISFLNDRLRDHQWRPLDRRVPFDRTILDLGSLELDLGEDGEPIRGRFRKQQVDGIRRLSVSNVPAPLVVIHAVLDEMAAAGQKLPLECRLYELI